MIRLPKTETPISRFMLEQMIGREWHLLSFPLLSAPFVVHHDEPVFGAGIEKADLWVKYNPETYQYSFQLSPQSPVLVISKCSLLEGLTVENIVEELERG